MELWFVCMVGEKAALSVMDWRQVGVNDDRSISWLSNTSDMQSSLV
jgi:hypothetical protein